MDPGGAIDDLGIHLNTELAKAAGLEVDDGIRVNRRLQTEDPDSYAIGELERFLGSPCREPPGGQNSAPMVFILILCDFTGP